MTHLLARAATVVVLVVALVGCGGSAASTAPRPSSPASEPSAAAAPSAAAPTTPITVRDFTLDPKEVSVQGAVSLAVTNAGPTLHNIAIRDAAGVVVATTKDLKAGEAETIAPSLPKGTYTLFCSLPGHESLGIKGTLTVS